MVQTCSGPMEFWLVFRGEGAEGVNGLGGIIARFVRSYIFIK